MGKIKVFLCDDHRLFRDGVKRLLEHEKNISVIGEAENGLDAVKEIKRLIPDVVLMDIGMPKMNGVDATRKLKREFPDIKVIILTVHQDEANIFDAIKAGASGYILKDVSGDDLINAVRKVNQNEALIEPKIAAKVLSEFKKLSRRKKPKDEEVYGELTERENEILRWISLGATNKEIASRLQISDKTVKNHISNIFQKLHVNSRTQAALYVLREKRTSQD
jgi:DNA-binding NarL/FixJ family response regulator